MATILLFIVCYNYIADEYEDDFDLEESQQLLSAFQISLATNPTSIDHQSVNKTSDEGGLHSIIGFLNDTSM